MRQALPPSQAMVLSRRPPLGPVCPVVVFAAVAAFLATVFAVVVLIDADQDCSVVQLTRRATGACRVCRGRLARRRRSFPHTSATAFSEAAGCRTPDRRLRFPGQMSDHCEMRRSGCQRATGSNKKTSKKARKTREGLVAMTYNITIITLRPGTTAQALARIKAHATETAKPSGELLASWFSDIGALNRILLIHRAGSAEPALADRADLVLSDDPFGCGAQGGAGPGEAVAAARRALQHQQRRRALHAHLALCQPRRAGAAACEGDGRRHLAAAGRRGASAGDAVRHLSSGGFFAAAVMAVCDLEFASLQRMCACPAKAGHAGQVALTQTAFAACDFRRLIFKTDT